MAAKKIKKILLIIPPNTLPADSLRRIGEPLGVLYLGTILKERGYEVEIYIQDITEEHTAKGVFSLLNNSWINSPDKINPVISPFTPVPDPPCLLRSIHGRKIVMTNPSPITNNPGAGPRLSTS